MSCIIGGERPQLKDIDNHVVPRWAPQWKQLGRQLNIADHLLNIIDHNYHNDCEECCSKMLSNWLDENESSSITWDAIYNALVNLPEDFTGLEITNVIFIFKIQWNPSKRTPLS